MSPQGVLSSTGGCVHWPVCGLHGGSLVQALLSGGQGVCWCVWTHWPISQPAVVQRFPSTSPQGVLSGRGGNWHRPVAGLHPRSLVHSLPSGAHGVFRCVWTHWPASQPAVVHKLLSVSPQGVLSPLLVTTHWPVVWLQTEFVHSVPVQTGQSGMEEDCAPPETSWPLCHIPSMSV